MADGDSLSVPNPDGCCAKLALLWVTNKPLAILLLVIAALIQLGIIFLIVWFLILHKGSGSDTPAASSPTAATTNTAAKAAHATFQHLCSLVSQSS